MPIITFASLSPTDGGTGKDTFAVNTATWLAKAHNQSVVVVDLNPYGNMQEQFGETDNMPAGELMGHIFLDTTLTSETIKQIIPKFRSLGFWMLPTNYDGFDYADEGAFLRLKASLTQTFDVVIFNLTNAMRKIEIDAIRQSNLVFLVGTDDHINLEKYENGLNAYKDIVNGDIKILINRGFGEHESVTTGLKSLGYEVFAYAIDDEEVFVTNREGKAIVLTNPNLSFSRVVRKVGEESLKCVNKHTATNKNSHSILSV